MRKNFGVKTFLYPQPVLIIATYNEDGSPNAMNAAWGGMYDNDKICIALADHKTTENLLARKAFTISIGDETKVASCDYVGMVSGRSVKDKFLRAGFTPLKSEYVDAPLINELPLTLECTVESLANEVLIGKIINVSADEAILGEDGLPTLEKFSPIVYDPIHNDYLNLGKVVAKAFTEGKKIK